MTSKLYISLKETDWQAIRTCTACGADMTDWQHIGGITHQATCSESGCTRVTLHNSDDPETCTVTFA